MTAVAQYEVSGETCMQTWNGTLCLRLEEPKQEGEITFQEIMWHVMPRTR